MSKKFSAGMFFLLPSALADIVEVWRRESAVGTWLLDLTAMALTEDEALDASKIISAVEAGQRDIG